MVAWMETPICLRDVCQGGQWHLTSETTLHPSWQPKSVLVRTVPQFHTIREGNHQVLVPGGTKATLPINSEIVGL